MGNVKYALLILSLIMTGAVGDIPDCNYFDTVNLTNSQKYENDTYEYDNTLIPKEKTGQYGYQILWEGSNETVPIHTRGCICSLKSCVRFCCDPHKLLVQGERECKEEIYEYNSMLNITLQDGTEMEINALKDFVIQHDFEMPCEAHYHLDGTSENNMWTLHEDNGNLYLHYDDFILPKEDYCLQPHKFENGQIRIVPHQCTKSPDEVNSYLQIASVIFMIITIALHVFLPQYYIRNIQSKCCIFYFVCLTVSFSMLRIENQFRNKFSKWLCYSIAYFGYYAVMATFLWLYVINFSTWRQFRSCGIKKANLLKCNLLVWSVAAVLLLITALVDYLNPYDERDPPELTRWQPGFCAYTCWIKTNDQSAMIYYHGPMLILNLLNIMYFISTAKIIFKDNKSNERKSDQATNRATFFVFFRLFGTAGLLWLLEVVSYLSENSTNYIDIITSAQGIIIFIVTLSMEMLKKIYNRIFRKKGTILSYSDTKGRYKYTECRVKRAEHGKN